MPRKAARAAPPIDQGPLLPLDLPPSPPLASSSASSGSGTAPTATIGRSAGTTAAMERALAVAVERSAEERLSEAVALTSRRRLH